MRRSKRLQVLCSELCACDSFADVGCDHGYCTQYMLEKGLCRSAVISDISEKSLRKAETLLSDYIASGKVRGVCCFGLSGIPSDSEQVLIAGMGGEEIVSILQNGFFPNRLVLQPMKNTPKLRRFLLDSGYSIVRDYTFMDGKHYDVLCALRKGARRAYGERELRFGYDNVHTPSADFLRLAEGEIEKCRARLRAAGEDVPAIRASLKEWTEVRNEITRNL